VATLSYSPVRWRLVAGNCYYLAWESDTNRGVSVQFGSLPQYYVPGGGPHSRVSLSVYGEDLDEILTENADEIELFEESRRLALEAEDC